MKNKRIKYFLACCFFLVAFSFVSPPVVQSWCNGACWCGQGTDLCCDVIGCYTHCTGGESCCGRPTTCDCSNDPNCPTDCQYDECLACGGSCLTNAECCVPGDCFAPGTKVKTPEGDKPIENISIGEQISSFDPKTSQSSASSVQETFQYDKQGYYQIKLEGDQELKVTENHPLYTIQKTEEPFTFWQYLKTESLTKKLVDYLFK